MTWNLLLNPAAKDVAFPLTIIRHPKMTFTEIQCALAGCTKTFTPKRFTDRFCCRAHQKKEAQADSTEKRALKRKLARDQAKTQ